MEIDLSLLHNKTEDSIDISGEYILPSSYYENSDIIKVLPVTIKGEIIEKTNEEGELDDYLDGMIEGSMILSDSISLEEVNYPFSIHFADFLEKNTYLNENILDIFEFLWENILLEVPLHYSVVEDLKKFQGDGWKLIHEDEIESNQPFRDLLKDVEKE